MARRRSETVAAAFFFNQGKANDESMTKLE
jgi:hypothetical protein